MSVLTDEIRQLVHVVDGDRALTNHSIDFLAKLAHRLRVFQQVIYDEGQQAYKEYEL